MCYKLINVSKHTCGWGKNLFPINLKWMSSLPFSPKIRRNLQENRICLTWFDHDGDRQGTTGSITDDFNDLNLNYDDTTSHT